MITILPGDCRTILPTLADASVHSRANVSLEWLA